MTTPVVIQTPGVGAEVQSALAPLLQVLMQRQAFQQREEDLKLRKGELKLAQEESEFKRQLETEKQAVAAKQRAQTEAAITALLDQMGQLQAGDTVGDQPADVQQPGAGEPPLMSSLAIRTLLATGDATNIRAATNLVMDEVAYRKAKAISASADVSTPEGRADLITRMAVVDPQRAVSIAQVLQTMENRSRTQFKDFLHPDGTYHTGIFDMDSGGVVSDLGPARLSYTDRLLKWGDVEQRARAEGAVKMGASLDKMSRLSVDTAVLREASAVISAVTGTVSFPVGIGDFLSTAVRITAHSNVSPAAQELLNNVWEFLGGRSFATGGKQLTKTEWDVSSRQYAPVIGESARSWNDKVNRMYRERDTNIRLAGGAWDLVKDLAAGWSAPPGQSTAPASSLDQAIEDILNRIRAKKEGGQP